MQALFFVLVALIIGVGFYIGWHLKQKRREELTALASRLGMIFAASDPFGIDDVMPHQMFSMGDGRGCENVMWGTWSGMPVTAFDYWYYTESTDSEGHTTRTYHRFTGAMTYVPADCHHLVITKENLLTRMADGLGFRDIQFETGEFNTSWQVKCPDRKFASDFVDQRMMEWLMYAGTQWSFEVVGRIALVYCRKLGTSEIPALLGCLKAFRDKIPPVVSDLYPLPPNPAQMPGAGPIGDTAAQG